MLYPKEKISKTRREKKNHYRSETNKQSLKRNRGCTCIIAYEHEGKITTVKLFSDHNLFYSF